MHMTPEDLHRCQELRIGQIVPETKRISHRRVGRASPTAPVEVKTHTQTALQGLAAANRFGTKDPGKTWRIVIPGSRTDRIAKEIHARVTAPETSRRDIRPLLDRIDETGASLFFFTLKGISSYPFLFCANLAYYGSHPDEFHSALEDSCRTNQDMYCDPATYRPITDREELADILEDCDERDMRRFAAVVAGVLGQGPGFRGLEFIGYDRRDLEL